MSFVDVFLRHTPATLVLCIVPINTIQNWKAEFDMWVPPSNCVDDALVLSGEVRPRDYNIYTLNENFKTMAARASLIGKLFLCCLLVTPCYIVDVTKIILMQN